MNAYFGHITQIVVAVVSLVGVIYSANRGRQDDRKGRKEKRHLGSYPTKYKALFIVSFVLTVVNIGIFGWRLRSDSASVEITHPKDKSVVSESASVTVNYAHIDTDQTIWIVVYSPSSDKYFPQGRIPNNESGTWSLRNRPIGSSLDSGQEFDIMAFTLSEDASRSMENVCSVVDFAGLIELPTGASLCDRITVTRK